MSTPTTSDHDRHQQQLVQRRAVLREEVAATLLRIDADRYAALADQVHDTKDHSIAQSLIATGNAEVQRDTEELQDIEAALERIRTGSYGNCVVCGSVIPAGRLDAYPAAKRCLPCQAAYEKSR
jgi:RNA polymerase-binding transcription factor